jgi:prepilin-type processing-associated H-X9-DG protein
VKVPEVLGLPPMYVLLEVKDAQKAQVAIDKLIASLEKGIGSSVMRTTQDYKGVGITSLSLMPGGMGHGVSIAALPLMRPAYAVVGDFLVVSVHANLVKKIVDVHQGEKSLKDDPDFQRVFGKVAPSGTITTYVNMKEIYDFLYGTFSGLAATQVGPEMIGKLGRISQYLGSTGGRLSWDGKGFLSESFSDSAGAEQILVQVAVMNVLPAFFKAREKAQEAACLANLRQLSVACMMYATDHDNMLPAKLSELRPEYVAGTDVFICPVHRTGKAAKVVVDVDRDSDYELKLPGQKLSEVKDPARTIMLLEKQPNHRGGRAAAFVDGHVERGVRIGQTEPAPPVMTPQPAGVSFLNAMSRFRL